MSYAVWECHQGALFLHLVTQLLKRQSHRHHALGRVNHVCVDSASDLCDPCFQSFSLSSCSSVAAIRSTFICPLSSAPEDMRPHLRCVAVPTGGTSQGCHWASQNAQHGLLWHTLSGPKHPWRWGQDAHVALHSVLEWGRVTSGRAVL